MNQNQRYEVSRMGTSPGMNALWETFPGANTPQNRTYRAWSQLPNLFVKPHTKNRTDNRQLFKTYALPRS